MLCSVHSRGRSLVLDGGVLGRQSECVPAHGMKYVVALHPHVARQGIANGVVAHVSHVQLARRIGQHLQHVILFARAGWGLGTIEIGILGPAIGPLLLDRLRVVPVEAGTHAVVDDFSSGL